MKKLLAETWRAVGLSDGHRLFILSVSLLFIVGIMEGVGLLLLSPALLLASGHPLSPLWATILPPFSAVFLETALFSLFALFTILSAVARFLGSNASARLKLDVEMAMREKLTAGLFTVPWTKYQGLRAGDLVKAIVTEGHNAGWGVEYVAIALSSLGVSLFLLACTIMLGGILSAVVCLFGIVLLTILKIHNKKKQAVNAEISATASRVGEAFEETVSSMKFLRSAGLSAAAEKNLSTLYHRYRSNVADDYRYIYTSRLILEVFAALVVTLVILASIVMTAIPITQVLVFLMLFFRLAPRLQGCQDGFAQARNLLGWFEIWRTRQVAFAEISPSGITQVENLFCEIQFRNLEFAYDTNSKFRLGPIDLVVKPGSCIAFVGHSGSGKSTVVDLLLGLLSPSKGAVLIDNVSLHELDINALRRGVGIVMQDSPMFHASILENICLFEEVPDAKRAQDCAILANAWNFIEAQPQGLHTVIGEKGSRLSGGQRQRLALARALYRKPSILILDEPTSSLDDDSEAAILTALEELRGKMTIVLVSHRTAPLKLADVVISLKQGTCDPELPYNASETEPAVCNPAA